MNLEVTLQKYLSFSKIYLLTFIIEFLFVIIMSIALVATAAAVANAYDDASQTAAINSVNVVTIIFVIAAVVLGLTSFSMWVILIIKATNLSAERENYIYSDDVQTIKILTYLSFLFPLIFVIIARCTATKLKSKMAHNYWESQQNGNQGWNDPRNNRPYDDRNNRPYDDRNNRPYDDRKYDDRNNRPYDDRNNGYGQDDKYDNHSNSNNNREYDKEKRDR